MSEPISTPAQALQPVSYATRDTIPASDRFAAGRPARENAGALERFFTGRAEQSRGFMGADGVYSATAGGRTVFAFGDTFIGGRVFGKQTPGTRFNFLRSSFGVADGDEFRIVGPRTATRLRNERDWLTPRDAKVPLFGSKDWYWPGAMHVDANGLNVFIGRYHQGNLDVKWGWSRLGTSLATIDPDTLALRSITPVNDDGDTVWGAASLATPEHLYMYGGSREDGGAVGLKVARTKGSDPARGWEYLTADGSWSDDVRAAHRAAAPAASQFSVVANARGGVDLIVQEAFTPILTVTHGASPVGPWDTANTQRIALPGPRNPAYIYNAVVHESLSDAERLVVSVNQNSFSLPHMFNDPSVYRPHFFTIARPGTESSDDQRIERWGS